MLLLAGADKSRNELLRVMKELNIQLDNLCQVNLLAEPPKPA
jgi:hypothetical protein